MIETNAWRKFLANLNRDCIQAISPQWICPKFPGDERLWLQSMICDVIYNDAAHWLNVRGIHGFPHEGHPISHFDSWNLRQNRLLDLLGWCNDEAVQLEVCGLMAVSV